MNCKIINSEVVNLYKTNSFKSEIVSQALLWENVDVLIKKDNWYKIKQCDGYESFVYKDFIIKPSVYDSHNLSDDALWYIVKKRITIIKSLVRKQEKIVSFGTVIPIINKQNDNSYVTLLPNNEKFFVNPNHLVQYKKINSFKNIVNYALNNLGVPYFWGGKSGFGYDCSGFIQHLYRFQNIILPRDSKDQVAFPDFEQVMSDYLVGDLIFFYEKENVVHVGMFINNSEFIHSSGYVKVNSIHKKDDNFNNNLTNLITKVFRMKKNV